MKAKFKMQQEYIIKTPVINKVLMKYLNVYVFVGQLILFVDKLS